MKKNILMSLVLILTLFQHAMAQTRSITGKVIDQNNGSGLPGVTVLLKGTSTGISTGTDGGFSISVPATGGTLVFSSVGFITQEQPIGSSSVVSVPRRAQGVTGRRWSSTGWSKASPSRL